MTDFIPAWAEAFHGEGPGVAPHLRLPGRPTRRWAYGDGLGTGVRVAVVDSGVDADHPLVGGVAQAVALERDANAPDGIRFVHGPHEDLYGHGTACAGIIRQLAPGVEFVSVRVLDAQLTGSAFRFARGLEWCLENDVKVVNLSLSTTNEDYAATFWDLVDLAANSGILLVSALSNERKRSIPSEFAGVCSVACAPGHNREQVWCNPNAPAEWGAAGIDVKVAWKNGGTLTATGNSFAAPVVAGHLARIVAAHPGITAWQARTVLASVATNRPAER